MKFFIQTIIKIVCMNNTHIKFSIIIAAKNEEQNLPLLFKSLTKLNYPKEYFEIIFVDDQSTDNTKIIIENFIEKNANISIYESNNKKYSGKRGALEIGISHTKYEYIMITDADCEPQPEWLNSFAERFKQGYDFIFGIAPFHQTNSFVNKISCFENLRSQLLMFTVAKMGFPYSAAARSFGFRKTAFDNLEGYKNTTKTISGDDDLLLQEAIKHNMKIGTVEIPDAFVYSSTKNKFKEYLIQKARHTASSNYYLLKHKIFLGIWHLLNLSFLFSVVLTFIDILFALPFVIKLIFDVITVQVKQKHFGYKFGIAESVYLQIIYELLIIVNYLKATFGKTKWK